ncbi:MAG TPA: hypothetical protein VNU84_08225 [Candidatus Acidoferrum sp.]|jgi:hypothetical protein|nr:hypothetical protein [Candidatus Acidoferrum sp.]
MSDLTSGPNQPASHSARSRILRLSHWLAIVTFAIVAIYDSGELVKELRKHEAATSKSIFAVNTELEERYSKCTYHLLFFCDESGEQSSAAAPGCQNGTSVARSECALTDNGKFATSQPSDSVWSKIPLVGLVVAAAVTAPKIPDAAIKMLKHRWTEGSLQFSVGLVFLFGWVALVVLALRQQSPENLLWLAAAIVFGPYLLMGGFWLLQHIFDTTAAGIDAMAGYLISIIGLPGCILMCTAHDAKEVAELAKAGHHVPKL